MPKQKKRFSKQLELYKEIRKTDKIDMRTKRVNSMRRTENKPQVLLGIKREVEESYGT
jgi:hypothetical protein